MVLGFWPVQAGMGRFMSGLGLVWVSGRCGLVCVGSRLIWGLIWGGFRPAQDRPRPDHSLFGPPLGL